MNEIIIGYIFLENAFIKGDNQQITKSLRIGTQGTEIL